jgi:DNA-binding MarR family transcriptional regulator
MISKKYCNHMVCLHDIQKKIMIIVAAKKDEELLTQTEIARRLDVKISTLNYHFLKLVKGGYIIGYGELTDKGKRYLRFFMRQDKTYSKKLRAHNIQAVLFPTKVPAELWGKKNTILRPFTNNRYKGLMCELVNCSIMIYSSKKIVVKLPDIYGDDDEVIAATAIEAVEQLLEALKLEFGIEVKGYDIARFTTLHLAVLNSIVAEKYILKNGHNFKGKKISVDKSHGIFELEAENAATALEDIEVLVKIEDVVAESEKLKEMISELGLEEVAKEWLKKGEGAK